MTMVGRLLTIIIMTVGRPYRPFGRPTVWVGNVPKTWLSIEMRVERALLRQASVWNYHKQSFRRYCIETAENTTLPM